MNNYQGLNKLVFLNLGQMLYYKSHFYLRNSFTKVPTYSPPVREEKTHTLGFWSEHMHTHPWAAASLYNSFELHTGSQMPHVSVQDRCTAAAFWLHFICNTALRPPLQLPHVNGDLRPPPTFPKTHWQHPHLWSLISKSGHLRADTTQQCVLTDARALS